MAWDARGSGPEEPLHFLAHAHREEIALYSRNALRWLRGNDIDADNSAIGLGTFDSDLRPTARCIALGRISSIILDSQKSNWFK